MKGSRYAAVGLVAAAALWIFSGHLGPHGKGESAAANRPAEAPAAPLFRVSVMTAEVAPHVRQLYLSGRTEAEHKVMITSRTNGLLEKLNVKRGQAVQEGEIVAVLSDEAREAQVGQASALMNQRKAELEARRKLIEQGTLPRLDGVNLESQYRTAAAALAAAEAERDRGVIRAPWAGIITDVPRSSWSTGRPPRRACATFRNPQARLPAPIAWKWRSTTSTARSPTASPAR
jgi:multidrug efflux system membrane fusion protein